MNRFIKSIFNCVFPFFDNYKINKKVKKDNTNIFSYIENSEKISLEKIEEQYNDSLSDKSKLEDKAKTSIVGITITITLILSISNVLNGIVDKYNSKPITWIAFFLALLSVVYMVGAGILAIKVLVNENIAYKINIKNLSNDKKLRKDYECCISKNRNQNIVRNNNIYTSYECIRNSIVCLLIIFIMLSLPISNESKNIDNYFSNNSFMYTESAIEYFENNDIQVCNIEDLVNTYVSNHSKDIVKNKFYGIYDDERNTFIKFKIVNDSINIVLIEPVEDNS